MARSAERVGLMNARAHSSVLRNGQWVEDSDLTAYYSTDLQAELRQVAAHRAGSSQQPQDQSTIIPGVAAGAVDWHLVYSNKAQLSLCGSAAASLKRTTWCPSCLQEHRPTPKCSGLSTCVWLSSATKRFQPAGASTLAAQTPPTWAPCCRACICLSAILKNFSRVKPACACVVKLCWKQSVALLAYKLSSGVLPRQQLCSQPQQMQPVNWLSRLGYRNSTWLFVTVIHWQTGA